MHQKYAHSATVRIDDEEYNVPTNGVEITLNLRDSELDIPDPYIMSQPIEGLVVDESDLPEEYRDRYHAEYEILICDPVVHRDDGDVVVSGNTNFHGMGDSIKLRVDESVVTLGSNIDEGNWARFKHKFDGILSKDLAINPDVEILDVQ